MNLKKTAFSLLAVIAMTFSVAVPATFADRSSSVSVTDIGELTTGNLNQNIIFDEAGVDTNKEHSVTPSHVSNIRVTDTRTNGDGFKVTFEFSDLYLGGDSENPNRISNSNLEASFRTHHWVQPTGEPIGNPVVTPFWQTTWGTMDSPVVVMSAEPGRGINQLTVGMNFELTVPGGQMPGQYQGDVVITHSAGGDLGDD